MTDFYAKDDEIAHEKIRYCFGVVPASANQKAGRFVGTFKRKGFARVVPPLYRSPDGKPASLPTIHCESARFGCERRPKLPGRKIPCGGHTCFHGIIKGKARVKIQTPLREHAN